MRVFWHNGAVCAEPEGPIEAEAMLLLLRNVRYELPENYNEDGHGKPPENASGQGSGDDLWNAMGGSK